jgi:diguanylate cyclase (GGDEF)-like protein/PAS domain S-box-containing protein
MATITFVDATRQWFKSSVGLGIRETGRDIAFCAHAIEAAELFVVEDAWSTPLFANNPLSVSEPGIRFYAGMPLVVPEGVALGTLAVMDHVPRVLTSLQVETLQTLAQQVVAQLVLRRQRQAAEARNAGHARREEALLSLRDGNGQVTQVEGILRDISNKKQGEHALIASEQSFRDLADAMPYIVWSAEPTGQIDYGNRTIIDYAGLQDIDRIGEQWIDLLHPEDVDVTLSRWTQSVRSGDIFSFEYRLRRADQTYRWHLAKGMPIRDDNGTVIKWYGTTMDIHDMKLAHEEIGRLAFYDPLTQLPNRQLLMDRLAHALSLHAKSGRMGAVMVIDLDNFKSINDTLGHDKGDILLDQVARRLTGSVTPRDTVARLGGDEFVIVLEDIGENREAAARQADRTARVVLEAVNGPFDLAGHVRHITPSVGVALFGDASDGIGELLKRADMAMYQAKATGRNTIRFFDPKIQAVALARAALEIEMRQGLPDKQFVLQYQPQVNADGEVIGVEALVRWQHPGRGMVSPGEFIPVAEETGLILPLGRWVLDTACANLALLGSQPVTASIIMAVNVSALQFRQPDFVPDVLDALKRTGARPDRLKIELTESLLLDGIEDAIEKMGRLKTHGVRFSLDDFGTGYSSLSYLKRLPLDQLKIDQSFVRNVTHDSRDAAIVSTIITLGHTMGMSVIAEGVETAAQRDFLAERGCSAYQGYLFSRPLPWEQLNAFLSCETSTPC